MKIFVHNPTVGEAMKTPFIVIDGLDGCGKGTQLKLLEERASREGHTFVFTREPGGAPLSEKLRELFKSDLGMQSSALTQAFMMWAARRNYLEKIVWPALEKGIPVFSDRGDSSTLAYQVYAKQAPELEEEFWHMRELVFAENAPTLYLFLDVPAEIARERSLADSTHDSNFDTAPVDFHQRVRKGFVTFGENSAIHMITIDGVRDPQTIHEDMYRAVSNACGW